MSKKEKFNATAKENAALAALEKEGWNVTCDDNRWRAENLTLGAIEGPFPTASDLLAAIRATGPVINTTPPSDEGPDAPAVASEAAPVEPPPSPEGAEAVPEIEGAEVGEQAIAQKALIFLEFRIELTRPELAAKSDELVSTLDEIDALESAFKATKAPHKSKLEAQLNKAKRLRSTLRAKSEWREVACEEIANGDQLTMDLHRTDTCEFVSARPMSVQERQRALFPETEVRAATV